MLILKEVIARILRNFEDIMTCPHSKSCQSRDRLFFSLLIRKSYIDLKVRKTVQSPKYIYRNISNSLGHKIFHNFQSEKLLMVDDDMKLVVNLNEKNKNSTQLLLKNIYMKIIVSIVLF